MLKIKIIEVSETIVDKELANEFKGQFECLWENTEKYKTFSVPLEKEIRKVDKDGNEDVKTISYKKNLLIVQDLWQVHYQTFLIILQTKFTKFNVKIEIFFLNMTVPRMIQIDINVYLVIKSI